MKKIIQNSENGFTILEVLIALAIFSIGILALAGLQISAIRGNDSASEFTQATAIAQNYLEGLLLLPYADNALIDRTGDGAAGFAANTAATADYTIPGIAGKFDLYYNLIENNPSNGSKQVALIIRWQESVLWRQIILRTIVIQ